MIAHSELEGSKMPVNSSSHKEKPLSATQLSLIAELVSGKTIKDAARITGIDEKTAHTWLKQPLFQKEYNEAKQTAYNEKLDMLKSGVAVALRTLLKHMTDANTKPYVQVQAASKWLDAALEVHKMQELELRIIELEAKLKAGDK